MIRQFTGLSTSRRAGCAAAAIALLASACGRRSLTAAAESIQAIEASLRHDRYPAARARAHQGALAWVDRPGSEPYNQFRLLESEALLLQARPKEAFDLLSSLHAVPAALQAQRDIDLGNALLKLGRLDEAWTAIERGLGEAEAASQDRLATDALSLEAAVLVQRNDLPGDERVLRLALKRAELRHDDYQRAKALNQIGMRYFRVSEFDRALPYFEQARSLFQTIEAPQRRAMALANLATCYEQLGDLEQALEMQLEASAAFERLGAKSDQSIAYGELARLYQDFGDLPKAISYYRRALDLALPLGDRESAATSAVNLASAYIGSQDWNNAERYNQQALSLSPDAQSGLPPYVDWNSAAIAAGRGDRPLARRTYERLAGSKDLDPELRWTAYGELAKLDVAGPAGGRPDWPRAQIEFERAISLIEGRRAELAETDSKLTFLARPIGVYQDYIDALAEHGDWRKALVAADSSRAQVLGEELQQKTAAGRVLGVEDLQRVAAAAQAILLSYWIAPKRSFAWVVTATGSHFIPLPDGEAAISLQVDSCRSEIEHGSRDPLTNAASACWKLAAQILRPVEPWIPRGSNVIVAPDGPLNRINLETLPASGDPPRYWIEDVTISVAPSLGLLAALDPKPPGRARGALIVGDPQPVARFPKLGYAAREMESIESRLRDRKPVVLSGPGATPGAYQRADPSRFAFLHFAAHAEANERTPLDSAVILSPEEGDRFKLYARDILAASPPLQAELVTVSACRGAGAKEYRGEGLIGFAWAFLHAGARNVIAGLWDVDDASTASLMDTLYAGIQGGEAAPASLRAAKLKLMASGGNYRRPYYWAPFEIYRRSVR